MATPKAAAIYARISRDATGEALGVERQLEDCRALAKEFGWTVVDEYVDNDRSAYSGKPRPEYLRLLQDLKAGERDGIIGWHADRLHRSPSELETFISLCEAQAIEVRTVRAGILDLATPSGRTVARIHGALARGESEKMSDRLKRANRQRAEMGKPAKGGRRGYGYERDGTIREDEAAIIRELVERFLAGESLSSLHRWLNDDDVPPPHGAGKWWAATVRDILRSARISGQKEHLGEIVALGAWPAIITPEQTARIRHILDDPARQRVRTPSRYLLTGLIRCDVCGVPMSGGPKEGTPSYICRKWTNGCGRVSIKAEPVEDYARDLALTALDGPDLAAALDTAKSGNHSDTALADQIAADEHRSTELAESYADGKITIDQLTAATKRLTDRITAARARLAAHSGNRDLARYVGQGAHLRTAWDSMNLDQRRAIVRAVFTALTVKPATRSGRYGFDRERVSIRWRA